MNVTALSLPVVLPEAIVAAGVLARNAVARTAEAAQETGPAIEISD